MSAAKKGLGEILVRENLIDIDQLEQARKAQKEHGGRLMTALVRMGFVKDKELAEFLGQQYNLPTVDLSLFDIDTEALRLVPKKMCEKHRVIPVQKADRTLVVAFADPTNVYVKDDLSLLTRCKIEVVVSSEAAILNAIDKYYDTSAARMANIMSEMEESDHAFDNSEKNKVDVVDQDATGDDGPIVKFVNALLAEAIKLRASDIHIEPYEKRFRIRFRIDGSLVEKTQPPQGAANAIVSRIKILCKMDISERRRPQDGRLKVKLSNGAEVDFRVSCLPTMFGEKTVLRILDKGNLQVDLTKLGMFQEQLDIFKEAIHLPQGMVLITGPTGSGKTTTIYSGLFELNTPDTNITTAEDPVEFNLDGINQSQLHTDIGFGFPEALRSFLRQDPNVIMVGEIRDYETGAIAYKAASTGHMVVSTLHTNDAASTINRLTNMGIPPYIVAESTTLIVAQRMLRCVCKKCEVDHKVPESVLTSMGVPEDQVGEFTKIKKGEGCAACNGLGLAGRTGIFETMQLSGAVKEAVFKDASPLDIKRLAIEKQNMKSLRGSALEKLRLGMTTVEEVLNVTVGDDV